MTTVTRVKGPSTGALPAVPQIFEHRLDAWPLRQALAGRAAAADKIELLDEILADTEVNFTVLAPEERGQLAYRQDQALTPNFRFSSIGAVPFRDFAMRLLAASTGEYPAQLYMQAMPVRTCPALAAHVQPLAWVDPSRPQTTAIWIGSGGHVVNLHYDPYANFMCMLEGRKRVTLFPFDVLAAIYPGPFDRGLGGTALQPRPLARTGSRHVSALRRAPRPRARGHARAG